MAASLDRAKLKPFVIWLVIDRKGFYSPMFHKTKREADDCYQRYAHLRESEFHVYKAKVSQWQRP